MSDAIKPVAFRWGAKKLRGVEWRYTSRRTRIDATALYDQSTLDAAIAAERERCAKLCESRIMGDNNREDSEARRCAKAIRQPVDNLPTE